MLFKKQIKQKYRNLIQKYKNKIKEQKNNFICLLNHDIKTPILAHIQTLELLIKNDFGQINEIQKELLEEILNSNYFILQLLINQIFILNYENQNYELKIENINLFNEINCCLGAISKLIKEKGQKIILYVDKNISINGDRKIIQKIIYNLLQTSVFGGWEKSNIEIKVKKNRHGIIFSTKNKTTFMTKEKLKSMLEDNKKSLCDFNQLGMSLNLNIAKKLINANNWELIATSKKDNSSTFGFMISK